MKGVKICLKYSTFETKISTYAYIYSFHRNWKTLVHTFRWNGIEVLTKIETERDTTYKLLFDELNIMKMQLKGYDKRNRETKPEGRK